MNLSWNGSLLKDLPWDGSLLKDFINDNIIHKIEDKINKIKYWTIYYNYKYYICLIRNSDNATPCIYDEAMNIFNKPKVGTHYIKKGAKYVILHKVKHTNNYIIHNEIIINKNMSMDSKIKRRVALLYLVRDILGIPHTADSDLSLRKSNKLCYPDIVIAIKIYPLKEKIYVNNESTIPEVAIDKWFESDYNDLYKSLFNDIKTNEDIESYISNYRMKLRDIIKRVDNSFVYIIDLMVERLYNILSRLI